MKTIDKPISVFLVDDDNMFLSSLSHSLDDKFKSKVEINSFTTGEECLAKLDRKPSIVILDYHLNSENPKAMNGIQVLKKIKSENSKAMVIMLSSQDKLDVVSDSFRNGAFEYVVKNESFYIRIENMVKNIIFNVEIEEENNRYEKWNYIIGISLIALLIFDVIFYRYR